MSEIRQLREMHTELLNLSENMKKIQTLLIGDEFNPKGLIHTQEEMRGEIKEIKEFIIQQKTGLSLGKWILGTSLGAFLLSQFTELQHIIKSIFK